MPASETPPKVYADFNGLFGDILCISHGESCRDETGTEVHLRPGMHLTAFDEDLDDKGKRDDLLASGIVEQAPDWLQATALVGYFVLMLAACVTNPMVERGCVLPNKRLELTPPVVVELHL